MLKKPIFIIPLFLLTACAPQSRAIEVEEYAILGNADAPVTLVEYSDYQCPFCRKFTTEVLPLIKEKYIETGVVRLVYKDFPLHIHNRAIEAAVATHCAGMQDAYYPYHDLLFSRSGEISQENFGVWAEELGLDRAEFDACRTQPAMEQKVLDSIAEAKAHGVVGTPSFLVNGRYVAGAQPFGYFDRAIRRAMDEGVTRPEAVDGATCAADEDCGESRAFPPYCSRTVENEVCITSASPTCTYPGTAESACVIMVEEDCTPCETGYTCQDGECVAAET